MHSIVGLVAYDPKVQQSLSEIWIRLYIFDETRFGQFTRSDAKEKLADSNLLSEYSIANPAEYESSIQQWMKIKGKIDNLKGRKTWCHTCKAELNSYEYPWCLNCLWIKCSCGSCGCDY